MMNSLRKHLLIFLFLSLNICLVHAQTSLYPVVDNGLWGYINEKGKTVIEPQFHSAGEFSEGLAAVRKEGSYGYIDPSGTFIIPEQFDFAYAFKNGAAKVYKGPKPYFIDKKGTLLFDHSYQTIKGFDAKGLSIVSTSEGKYGIINHKGELVADTVYKNITPFTNGLAIVTGQNHEPYPRGGKTEPTFEVGAINTEGKFIIPFGYYKDISEFYNGFAEVRLGKEPKDAPRRLMGNVDTLGQLRFVTYDKPWELDNYRRQYFSGGLATVKIPFEENDSVPMHYGRKREDYKGVINANGEVIFSNKAWKEITEFHYNRAFAQNMDGEWYLIDRKGKMLINEPFKDILASPQEGKSKYLFQNGIAFVETFNGWSAIDTTGNFVLDPVFFDFDYRDLTRRGNIVYIREEQRSGYRYGFWDTKTGRLIEPEFDTMDFSEFNETLLQVITEKQMAYINRQGEYIWKEKQKKSRPVALNTDHMLRGYFYASSPRLKKLEGYGGWGGSQNAFHKISRKKFENGKLSMEVRPKDRTAFAEKYEGITLYVANKSNDTLYFGAQDSRLYLKMQALDQDGKWKDIEYLPSSWCGNSYHMLFLPPGYYWDFDIPKYEGGYTTRLRAELIYKTEARRGDEYEKVLYSNEYEGSINPGQFWRKEEYTPAGIMDPYVN